MGERSLNKCEFIGRLGRDSELKFTSGGTAVLNFNVATNWQKKVGEEYKDQTEWHRCVIMGKFAEAMVDMFKKGTRVFVSGSMRTEKYTMQKGDRAGQEVEQVKIYVNEAFVVQFSDRDKADDTGRMGSAASKIARNYGQQERLEGGTEDGAWGHDRQNDSFSREAQPKHGGFPPPQPNPNARPDPDPNNRAEIAEEDLPF